MTTQEQTQVQDKAPSQVVDLQEPTHQSRGFWRDAWRRLRRNRFALAGGTIIIAAILVAIFADLIAPYSFREQNLRGAKDSAPEWVFNVFPLMEPRDVDVWEFEAEAGEIVNIYMESEEVDARLEIYSPEREFLTEGRKPQAALGQPAPLGAQIRNFEIPESGTYRVFADRNDIGTGGSYQLWLLRGDADAPSDATLSCNEDKDGLSLCGTLADGAVATNTMSTGGYVRVNNNYPVGADNIGRDLFSRIVYGARISLTVAFVGPLVSLLVGLSFGLISGYFGGNIDNVMMRIVDTMYAFPTILLIILMMAYFRASGVDAQNATGITKALNNLDAQFGGMLFIFVGIGLTSWMQTARITRGQVLYIREQEFVTAAVSIGTSTPNIIRQHVLPNILGPIIVAETLTIPTYISYEAFLSFIGLGVNRPTPSWGSMIADGSTAISTYPHQAIFPAIALFMVMFAFNFLGDGLRDAFDPRTTEH